MLAQHGPALLEDAVETGRVVKRGHIVILRNYPVIDFKRMTPKVFQNKNYCHHDVRFQMFIVCTYQTILSKFYRSESCTLFSSVTGIQQFLVNPKPEWLELVDMSL